MRKSLLSLLRCPVCASVLHIHQVAEFDVSGGIEEGSLDCERCTKRYQITSGIPRFVQSDNYAENFGVQWNTYRRTQLDSYSGQSISKDRFEHYTGWHSNAIKGDLILDVGAGAGRFAEVAVKAGANVVAVDYSNAIDAARVNLGDNDNIDFVQADAAALPFAPNSFDKVYCLGVIQHTPNPDATFASLAARTRPGGALAIDVYPKHWKNMFFAKYWIRPITRRLSVKYGFAVARFLFPILYPISQIVGKIPMAGHYIKYVIPVVNYEGVYPLDKAQLREWAMLDTIDMWAPAYDQPQTMPTLRRWFENAGFSKIEVFHSGFYVGRGIKAED